MQRSMIFAAGMAVLVGISGFAHAADKASPVGTWKWSTTFNNQTRETTLKLTLDGDKLSGTISGRNNTETKIEDGTFKDGEVTFNVTRERNGQKSTTKYKGKVDGDVLKGTIERTRDGKAMTSDFEAKREKA